MTSLILKIAAPILVVGLGVAGTAALVLSRQAAPQAAAEAVALPVDVALAVPVQAAMRQRATGTLAADQQIVLSPQVAGRVQSVSASLRPGARVAKGEVLARIDPRDFQNAQTQAESQVALARVNLELERGRSSVAEREWALVAEGRSSEQAPLALRRPQLASTEAALASAEASLATAQLNLERATLRAPFDALVLSESVDVGQVVGAGTAVATLVGAERMRVELKVPVAWLGGLEIPGLGAEIGSEAQVTQLLGGEAGRIQREGRVSGLGGQIDAATRTATLLVEVLNPLGDGTSLPMLPGAFVEVELEGRTVDATALPSSALREGETVWVVDEASRLSRRAVQLGWREGETVYLLEGLSPGERAVTSPIALPVEGLAVRVVEGKTP